MAPPGKPGGHRRVQRAPPGQNRRIRAQAPASAANATIAYSAKKSFHTPM